jgi:hypothetical protein
MLMWHTETKHQQCLKYDGNVEGFYFPNGVHSHGARFLVCSSLTLIKMNEKVWLYLIPLPSGVLGTSAALYFLSARVSPKRHDANNNSPTCKLLLV